MSRQTGVQYPYLLRKGATKSDTPQDVGQRRPSGSSSAPPQPGTSSSQDQEQQKLKDPNHQRMFLWKVYLFLTLQLGLITTGAVLMYLFPLTEHPLNRGAAMFTSFIFHLVFRYRQTKNYTRWCPVPLLFAAFFTVINIFVIGTILSSDEMRWMFLITGIATVMCGINFLFCLQTKIHIFSCFGFCIEFGIFIVITAVTGVAFLLSDFIQTYYVIAGCLGALLYLISLMFESWALFQGREKAYTLWDACLAATTVFANMLSDQAPADISGLDV